MFNLVSSPRFTCAAGQTQWQTLDVTSGTVVNAGFQNFGNARDLYTTQRFVRTPTQAYCQVVNTGTQHIQWQIWAVVSDG